MLLLAGSSRTGVGDHAIICNTKSLLALNCFFVVGTVIVCLYQFAILGVKNISEQRTVAVVSPVLSPLS